MKNKLNLLHKEITSTWKIIRRSKGYKEWINADVGCFPLQVQIKIVLRLLLQVNNLFCTLEYREDGFDVLFSTMIHLYKDVEQRNIVDNYILNDLIKHYEFLHFRLKRILYIVQ
jgi:hypothetical protein